MPQRCPLLARDQPGSSTKFSVQMRFPFGVHVIQRFGSASFQSCCHCSGKRLPQTGHTVCKVDTLNESNHVPQRPGTPGVTGSDDPTCTVGLIQSHQHRGSRVVHLPAVGSHEVSCAGGRKRAVYPTGPLTFASTREAMYGEEAFPYKGPNSIKILCFLVVCSSRATSFPDTVDGKNPAKSCITWWFVPVGLHANEGFCPCGILRIALRPWASQPAP